MYLILLSRIPIVNAFNVTVYNSRCYVYAKERHLIEEVKNCTRKANTVFKRFHNTWFLNKINLRRKFKLYLSIVLHSHLICIRNLKIHHKFYPNLRYPPFKRPSQNPKCVFGEIESETRKFKDMQILQILV